MTNTLADFITLQCVNCRRGKSPFTVCRTIKIKSPQLDIMVCYYAGKPLFSQIFSLVAFAYISERSCIPIASGAAFKPQCHTAFCRLFPGIFVPVFAKAENIISAAVQKIVVNTAREFFLKYRIFCLLYFFKVVN